MITVIYSVILVLLNVPLRDIVVFTIIPLLVSSLCLVVARTRKHSAYVEEQQGAAAQDSKSDKKEVTYQLAEIERKNNFIFRAILLSATLFGFSYYALGFPIVTVAESQGSTVLGIITFGIYLGVSALAGYSLGSLRSKRPFRTLWSLGYMLAALSSLIIGT